jgi:PHS family inorganic phosphate transporter-like MFS transporter
MGVGIGGDYPLSAVITSEFSATKFRGRLMTLVFAAQGWGQFCMFASFSMTLVDNIIPCHTAAALIGLIVVSAFKHALLTHDTPANLKHVDYMWRILIGRSLANHAYVLC